jgi:DnaJ-class molecular chaperone
MKLEDFWVHLEAQVKLEEWEEKCDKCKGLGSKYEYLGNYNSSFPERCTKCAGTGKLDFIEKIVGKKTPVANSYTVHNCSNRDIKIHDLGVKIPKGNTIDLSIMFTNDQIEQSEDLKTYVREGVPSHG